MGRSIVFLMTIALAAFAADHGSGAIIVDFSPDTVAMPRSGSWSQQYAFQCLGDIFVLGDDYLITGGANFSTAEGSIGATAHSNPTCHVS